MAETISKVGKVDYLINNAGIVQGKWFADAPEADIRRTFDINVFGCLWVLQAAVRTGTIRHVTQICSVASFITGYQLSDYSASKFAINGFMRSIRLEFKELKTPITTTCIYPWLIDTGMFEGSRPNTLVNMVFPFLKEEAVGRCIFDSTCERREEVVIPRLFEVVNILSHLLPPWMNDRVSMWVS
jgi:NAD(P)-dependent dehydrogenase (short-subunit alcohol dehydrogenase family)